MSAPPGTEYGSAARLDSPGPAAAANGNAAAPPSARAGSRLRECWGSGGTPRPNGPRAPGPGRHPPHRGAPSDTAWNSSRAGAAAAAPANLCHWLHTLPGRNFILISKVSVPLFHFKAIPPPLIAICLCKKSHSLFLKYVNSKSHPRIHIFSLLDEDGHPTSRYIDMAKMFTAFFTSTFNTSDGL